MRQVAALPYRLSGDDGGTIEVLLITSFRTKRWIIPKGDIDGGMTPHAAAEKEAFEEAGVRGRIKDRPIGSFCYCKERNGAYRQLLVDVFPLEVSEELAKWQEMNDRERRWMPAVAAANTVEQPELQAILKRFRP